MLSFDWLDFGIRDQEFPLRDTMPHLRDLMTARSSVRSPAWSD
jgi:hypothetical protein